MESWNGSTGNTVCVHVSSLRLFSAFHPPRLTLIDFSLIGACNGCALPTFRVNVPPLVPSILLNHQFPF